MVQLGRALADASLDPRIRALLVHSSNPAVIAPNQRLAALARNHPFLEGVTRERLLEDGWARLNIPAEGTPFADGTFPTRSGKCELYSERLTNGGSDRSPRSYRRSRAPQGTRLSWGATPLSLVTGKYALHFHDSSYANLPHHRKAEGEPRLEMNAEDAGVRGISNGEFVRVFNDRGAVELHAHVGAGVRSGAVAMPAGGWASLSPVGTSANALTPDGLSD